MLPLLALYQRFRNPAVDVSLQSSPGTTVALLKSCFINQSQTWRSQRRLQQPHQFQMNRCRFWVFQPMPPSCSTLAQLNSSLIKLPALSASSRHLRHCRAPTLSTDSSSQETRKRREGSSKRRRRRRGKGHSVNWALLLPENDWVFLSTLSSVLLQVHQSCWSKWSRCSLKRQRLMHNNTSSQQHTLVFLLWEMQNGAATRKLVSCC